MNRLQFSTSPYLLQHAHNPVNWYPWGEEALRLSKETNKPILVSIGYSACHWCHVMERECFENEQLAQLMNEHFVCIKIDREERPDIDAIYMEAVQAMGVHGGWPLNVFLTPEAKPFYGGTYFPAANWGRLLQEIHRIYTHQAQEVAASADQIAQSIARSELQRYGIHQQEAWKPEDVSNMVKLMLPTFDEHFGGFNRAPKFPMPSVWIFLLRYAQVHQDEKVLRHVHLTLQRMLQGGIYDTLGGGFARYSVDAEWFAPHFEKMLYDNGQLLSLYAEAYVQSGEWTYREVMLQTISWMHREMLHPEGGFYSALDADSEGVEGKFYCWTFEEILQIIPAPERDLFCHIYSITPEGNWEHGMNILYRTESVEEAATIYSLAPLELQEKILAWRGLLLEQRKHRVRPGLDDKIITSWNGIALKGLCDAALRLNEPAIKDLARKNANFIANTLYQNGILYRTWKNGQVSIPGFLEDYALVAESMLAMYELTWEPEWLRVAHQLVQHCLQKFYDKEEGFFFYTSTDGEALIARKKELFDNVIPSSNAVMASVLFKLGQWLLEPSYTELASSMLKKMRRLLLTDPAYLTYWASLYQVISKGCTEVMITGPDAMKKREELSQRYAPLTMVCGATQTSEIPCLKDKYKENQTQLFVCKNHTCQPPVDSVDACWNLLQQLP
ncbi:MAG: thioredoxin domain-containing protein [Cytophagaceae bacterium]|jgi:hypothetical protein|nr:thioredoxin domain-containing protein [Cytophagaceae bacterium]